MAQIFVRLPGSPYTGSSPPRLVSAAVPAHDGHEMRDFSHRGFPVSIFSRRAAARRTTN